MGYLVVSAVLVVTLGRLGDIYGRVRMYNLGFTVFALGALALPFDPFIGPGGALWLIGWRVVQATGGAMLMANSPAILTDAFPSDQRGTAMGINQVAGISGTFIGLILGGILAAVDWRLVFIVSVPIGVGGAIWSYLSLREIGVRTKSRIDWLGNITFAPRPDRAAHRDHLRHPALRRARDGLDQPGRADRPVRRPRAAGGVLLHRDCGWTARCST